MTTGNDNVQSDAIIICAFAADPTIPSEPTIGWAFVRSAIRANAGRNTRVILVTNRRSAQAMADWASTEPNDQLDIVAVGLPKWQRWLERHRINGWARIEYLLWYLRARSVVRELCRRNNVLLAHHVTFATEMLPSPITCAGKGTYKVWGPVGSDGVSEVYGIPPIFPGTKREYWTQLIRDHLSRIFAPILGRRVDLVITSQRGTLYNHLQKNNIQTATFPNLILPPGLIASILTARAQQVERDTSDVGISVMYVGHLIPRKRAELAIAALAQPELRNARLDCFGNPAGGDLAPYQTLAEELGVADRVIFHGSVDRSVVLDYMCKADVLVHPSGREGAVGVIGEATVVGIPVVCFDGTGASLVLRAGEGQGVTVDARANGSVAAVASAIHEAASLGRGEPADWSTARFDALEQVLCDYATGNKPQVYSKAVSDRPEVKDFANFLWRNA